MKRTIWNVTLASIITLVVYIALNAFWEAIINEFENELFRLFLVVISTTVAFSFFLLYTMKVRKDIGEDEVMSDYKNREYISCVEDFKLIIKRELIVLICVVAIVVVCFALNTFDSLVFGKKMISFPTFFFTPMCLFGTFINIPFVGYAVSAVVECFMYIVFLLIYRKRKYDYWTKSRA